jgi:apolipoprotein N-acyltransferase
VLQGNIDQGVKWDRDWAEQTLQIYEDLSHRAAGRGAEAVLWPETAVPAPLFRDPGLRRRLATLARELKALLVVGGVGIDAEGDEIRFFDSAFAFGPLGQLRDRYDKSHLVPFGEYVPMRPLLGRFLGTVASGIASSDVSAGPGPRSLELPRAAGRGSVTVGVPICYELLFPDLVRRFVQDGAAVLFAVTNDAWYGRTGAPYQFLAMTALRSAETRVWTARAANTGVSAIIDHRGRVRARTRIFERDLLVADVPLRPPPRGGSLYARYGDVFVLGCWMVLGLRAWPERSRAGKGGRDEPVVDSHQPASR